jgi:alpha-glucosidase
MEAGAHSNYSVYEDSGVAVEYQKGVFARTPIKASQEGDTLKVEIGPVEGSYPGMLRTRGYEIRLPCDWPPASVTVNGVAIRHATARDKDTQTGWSFEGNTLTTVIPTPRSSTAGVVTIIVKRAAGLTARRNELDGFAGAMTRLRGSYDAMNQLWPVSQPPDVLVEAMQTGDRLSYHPENAVDEITHFHDLLSKAQAAIAQIDSGFAARMDSYVKAMQNSRNQPPTPVDYVAEAKRRVDAVTRARNQVEAAGK